MTGVLRRIARAPLVLYRWRCGWLLGHRFLALTHRGRRTGTLHQTVLEVLAFDRASSTAVVISGFGRNADWYRNVEHDPEVVVDVSRSRYRARARTLDPDAAATALSDYERRNRLMAPVLRLVVSRLVGWRYDQSPSARQRVVARLPIVELRPSPPS
jgi:deazaflavin-dependent oxidoreductase (nitroreductase family)